MILEKSLGGYIRQKVELEGSFRINGTSDPDDIRDGNSNLLAVARDSAGLFTVTIASVDDGGPTDLPYELIDASAHLHQTATPTVWSRAHIVLDSYSSVTRTFQIQVLKATAADDTADAASDADDNDVVSFRLVGSICTSGTDTSY